MKTQQTDNEIQEEFKKNLKRLQIRIEDLNLVAYYIKEILDNKESQFFQKHEKYFYDISNAFGTFAVIEICNIFDEGSDCYSLKRLKNYIHLNFFSLRGYKNTNIKHKEFYLSEQEVELFLNRKLDGIEKIFEKMKHIRDKCGLAHGMEVPELSAEEKVNMEEVIVVANVTYEILNFITKALLDIEVTPVENIIHYRTFNDIVKDFDQRKL